MSRTKRKLPHWLAHKTTNDPYFQLYWSRLREKWKRGATRSPLGSCYLTHHGKIISSGWDDVDSAGGKRFLKRQARRDSRRQWKQLMRVEFDLESNGSPTGSPVRPGGESPSI